MKTTRIKIATLLSLVFLMMNSCTDDFVEMNTPRNLLVEDLVNVDMLFTRVMAYVTIRDNTDGHGTIGNYSGMSVSGANRPFQEGESSGVWNATYGNYVRNLSDIINICQKKEDAANLVNKIAIARIMRAWAFARCTDVYGDIPYSESALPIERAVFQPKYDKQRDIYTDLFKELKEAAAQLDATKPSFGNADIMYGGNVAKWRKFANSLRLRLAMRVRYVDTAMAQAQMSDLNEADLITVRDDNAKVYTIADYPEHMNARWVDLVQRGRIVVKNTMPKTFLDILIGDGDAHNPADPRTKVYADTAKADWPGREGYESIPFFGYRGRPLLGMAPVQQGNPYGSESVSRWSDLLYTQLVERPLYRASETYFILAEAALLGLKGSAADAQTHYSKGLELSMEQSKVFYDESVPQLPAVLKLFKPEITDTEIADLIASKAITQEEIDLFLASSPVATLTGDTEQKLEQIINQKMIAFFPNEYEAWADYRRTGYPRILVGDDADDRNGLMPRRMPWPTNEQNINGEQYSIALQEIGGTDNRSARMWWDANPNPVKQHPGTVEWMEKGWLE